LLDDVTNPHFDTNTVSLQQLEETGLSIFTDNYNLLNIFNEKESVERLGGKLSNEFNAILIIRHIKKYKNLSLLCRKEKATRFLRSHGDGKLQIFDEAAREYFVSYLVPKGSPYPPRLRVLLGRIMHSDLVDKFDEDAKYEMELDPAEKLEDDDLDNFQRSLTLADLGVNFIILALGYVVSTAVFLVELRVGRQPAM
jgi:hypothetical protein